MADRTGSITTQQNDDAGWIDVPPNQNAPLSQSPQATGDSGWIDVPPTPKAAQQKAAPQAPSSPWQMPPPQTAAERYIWNPLGHLVGGAAASMAELGVGAKELLGKVIPSAAPTPEERAAAQPPPGVAGQIGYWGGQVLPYVAAGGVTAPLEAAATKGLIARGLPGFIARVAPQAATQAGTAAAIEGIRSGGDPEAIRRAAETGAVAPVVTGAVSSFIKGPFLNWWGKATGQGGQTLRTIATDADRNYVQAMKDPNVETRILNDFRDNIEKAATKRSADYEQQLGQLPSAPLDLTPTRQQAAQLLQKWGIGVDPTTGALDFSQTPGIGINQSDKGYIQDALSELNNWSNLSPAGVNTLKQRLYTYSDEAGKKAAPFLRQLADQVDQNLRNVKGYTDMTNQYVKDTDLINSVRQQFSAGVDQYGRLRAAPGTTLRKLAKTMSQDPDHRRLLLDSLDQAVGSHIRQDIAGYLSRPWIRPGSWKIGAAEVGVPLLLHHPAGAGMLIPTAMMTSPQIAARTIALISSMQRLAGRIPGTVQGAITGTGALMTRPQPAQLQPQPQQPQFAKGGAVADLERRAFRRNMALRNLLVND